MLEAGQVIDGRFEVECLLGEGGLATVYRVRHSDLGSVHALKLLSWRKQSLNERLLLEGRIQAQLNHPNIVAVTDLVRHDGQLGLLMEYVDNESLEEYLGTHGALGVERGLALFAPILSAVAAAHEHGVTHRDLKPANILLSATPRGLVPKVTDFGIAKVVADLAGHSTAAGSTMGTPGYLAPEQMADSSQIDARADVFALGAICWELITGRRAFGDEAGALTVLSTTQRVAPPVSDYVEGCPESVQRALEGSMEKDPADRFADCLTFARALYADHPTLLDEVLGNTSITNVLSLGGIRKALERTDQPTLLPVAKSTVDTAAPVVVAPAVAPAPPVAAQPGGMPLGLKVMAVLLVVGGAFTAIGIGGLMTATLDPLHMGQTHPSPSPVEPEPPSLEPAPVVLPVPAVAPVEPAGGDDGVAGELDAPPTPPIVPPEPSPVADVPPAPQPTKPPLPSEPGVDSTPDVPPDPPEPSVEPPSPVDEPQPVVVAPVPAPEPAPVVEPDPEPEPPNLAGTWVGKAAKLRLELRLTSTNGVLGGRALFTNPPRPRDLAVSGRVQPSGAVSFMAGDLRFTGSATGDRLAGTYTREGSGKAIPWSVSR